MGICWYCHWGWPEQVAAIHDRYLAVAGEPALLYGPAHIVWADENFERDSVLVCLDDFDDWVRKRNVSAHRDPYTRIQLDAVRESLLELLELPGAILEAMPADYDDEHPDQFPPAPDLTMVHR